MLPFLFLHFIYSLFLATFLGLNILCFTFCHKMAEQSGLSLWGATVFLMGEWKRWENLRSIKDLYTWSANSFRFQKILYMYSTRKICLVICWLYFHFYLWCYLLGLIQLQFYIKTTTKCYNFWFVNEINSAIKLNLDTRSRRVKTVGSWNLRGLCGFNFTTLKYLNCWKIT